MERTWWRKTRKEEDGGTFERRTKAARAGHIKKTKNTNPEIELFDILTILAERWREEKSGEKRNTIYPQTELTSVFFALIAIHDESPSIRRVHWANEHIEDVLTAMGEGNSTTGSR